MKMTLKSVNNPDFEGDNRAIAKTTVEVSSFSEASKISREYIDNNGLGSGNWAGGEIYKGGIIIAHVSYNGRVWEGAEYGGKEITI